MTSLAVWGSSAGSSRQLHRTLCRRSWSASDWREAFEPQPSAVFLGKRRWRGSSRQPGSWKHVHTAPW